ncbi:hypothetical protein [Amycolatopsis cihanbeyliensis]|uniref:Uncharacterized protein n=1 Tax=Amycolatopsis cihanbeyliensis TaxID=1128664 RepID=A0A542DCG7_AMYCI|nr:hypothetical protein [Amycolatopsis cihanbeyliensis]TQJ00745.1 hypothetical protein FB471_0394 [Amycolatopsis cihanbeyliensis]
MTYPPQQPGPYGRPDPYGQQGPYGQPPQPAPRPQPGGGHPYPPQGQPPYGQPYPTQQFGQPDPYGQQQPGYDPYGQQPGGYPGGPGGPPPKKKTGLIAGLAIAGVLVIGGAAALIIWLTGKDDGTSDADDPAAAPPGTSTAAPPTNQPGPSQDTATPEAGGDAQVTAQLAENYASALTSGQSGNLAPMACKKPTEEQAARFDAAARIEKAVFTVKQPPTVQGSSATGIMTGKSPREQKDFPFKLKKQGDQWCADYNWEAVPEQSPNSPQTSTPG